MPTKLFRRFFNLTKTHKRIFVPLGVALFIPLWLFTIFSFLPPKIDPSIKGKINPDQSFTFDAWGFLDTASISPQITPSVPVSIKVESTFLPFYKKVTIEPKNLLKPQGNYQVEVSIKNWFGWESKENLSAPISELAKVIKTKPENEAVRILPKAPLEFVFDKQVSKGNFQLDAQPPFEYTKKMEGITLKIEPKTRLVQGQRYEIALKLVDENIGTADLYKGSFTVIDPLEVSSDPADQSTSVLKQTSISLTFNKPVEKSQIEKSLAISPSIEGEFAWLDEKSVKFTPTLPLQTGTEYTLTLPDSITALDHSQLKETKVIKFTTAGPVKVLGFSPTGAYFPTSSSVKITFDQPVDHLSAEKLFSITPAAAGSFSWSENTLLFKPSGLNPLTKYTVGVGKGVKTIGGEDSVESFSASFTTTSERSSTIGYSVKGRPINAYYFGTGSKKILLVGALHGNESNTNTMLNQWISFLRANQLSIGTDRTFVIVPNSNPDGVASGNRFNANGVDLNRNWDLPDWQALTYWKNNSYPNGGGSAPFSEPETRALSNLIITENPVRIATYHAAANLVIGGGASSGFASWYASLTGYILSLGSGEEDEGSCQSSVGYCVTGSMEEWTSKRGHQTIVVEFVTASSSEYAKNLPALKNFLTTPL